MKSVVAICALVLASNSFADSPVKPKQKSTSAVESTTAQSGFVYPAPILNESEFIETGVLFVYNDHILNYFKGDSEQLLNYVNANIDHNNQAFKNSNIGLKRVVTGLIRVESNDIWSPDSAYTDRLHALAKWQHSEAGKQIKQQHQYSYLVSLAGFQTFDNESSMLGQAFVGDNVSWISPYNTKPNLWLERTLAHELSHNDGFKHESDDYKQEDVNLARHDAVGYQCGSHGSIMFVTGARTEPFFSDTDINLEEKQQSINCGSLGVANAAQVYRDLLTTTFAKRQGTFKNIQATRAKTGVVSIHENVSTALEGYNIEFDIIFEGADAGDSINYIVRQGTAGLNDVNSTIGFVTHDGTNNVYTISLPTLTDNIDEATENFMLELVYPNGVTIDSANALIEANIFDKNNDVGYVEFSTTSVSVEEGQSAEITINRIGGNEGLISYDVETTADSATQSDFEFTSQSITFKNGETSKTLYIKTTADSESEQNESFTVKITQTLHPLYSANEKQIKNQLTVIINSPAEANASASPVAIKTPTTAGQNTASGQSSGGSLGFLWVSLLLLVALRRHKRT